MALVELTVSDHVGMVRDSQPCNRCSVQQLDVVLIKEWKSWQQIPSCEPTASSAGAVGDEFAPGTQQQ